MKIQERWYKYNVHHKENIALINDQWNKKVYYLFNDAMHKKNRRMAEKIQWISKDMKETTIREHINQEKMQFLFEYRKFKSISSTYIVDKILKKSSDYDSERNRNPKLKFSVKKYFFLLYKEIPKKEKLQQMILSAAEACDSPTEK